jgi:hypothetical protein
MRQRLPNRRASVGFTIAHPGLPSISYEVMLGFDGEPATGAPREVFISCNKLTSDLDLAARDVATAISIALQYGARVEELAAAVSRGDDGKPQGVAGAVLDAILERRWA